MAFRLPRLSLNIPVVAPDTGIPTNKFQVDWQNFAQAIEAQENNQDTALSQLQAALALAGTGVVNNDAATGAAKSGQTTTTGLTIDSSTFVLGPVVSLTGVTAPMTHLTLTGSAPQNALSIDGPMDGEYRVVEVGAGVTIFTGTFTVRTLNTGATVINLQNPVNSQIFTRSTTGAVSYRLDLRKTAGAGYAANLQAYLFARRAP